MTQRHPAQDMPMPKGYRCPACGHSINAHREHGCDVAEPSVCECIAPYGRVMPADPPPTSSAGQITIDRAEARQRVAKFLFLSERDSPWAEREWDMPQHCNQAPWLRRADKLLTVAAGEEG